LLQVKPQALEVQVAIALGGALHSLGMQQLPAGMQLVPQRW
jgi:hypothetical protein